MRTTTNILLTVTALMLVWAPLRTGAADPGYLYLSPLPGSGYAPTGTEFILVRFAGFTPGDVTNLNTFITVTGETSGVHAGTTRVASDGRTVVFQTTMGFNTGELVTVDLDPMGVDGGTPVAEPYQFQFRVDLPFQPPTPLTADLAPTEDVGDGDGTAEFSPLDSEPEVPMAASSSGSAATGPMIMPNGVSVPTDFPHINITVNDNPHPWVFSGEAQVASSKFYNVIFNNDGNPVWYERVNHNRPAMALQANGELTLVNSEGGRDGIWFFEGWDTNYNVVSTYAATNGFGTDAHECFLTADGSYFMIGYQMITVDMTQYDPLGRTNAQVTTSLIQEFTPAGELVFQWRGIDHYDLANLEIDRLTSSKISFPHMNSIVLDQDGHILVSCRKVSEVTKIDRDSGDIIWRLGGVHSTFTFVDDELNGFRSPHTVRVTGPLQYMVFDNGNLHNPRISRAAEYELDLTNLTATLIWQHRESPDIYSHFMGNVQRLPNGNTLINWAVQNLPKLTEVRPDGTKAFEMNWAKRYATYRVWRYDWRGVATKPYLLVEPDVDNVQLLFNQFGDTSVDHYRIYGGTTASPTNLLATSQTTLKRIYDVVDGVTNFFRVTSVSTNGVESDFSNEQHLLVNIIVPGDGILENPDFSEGTDHWNATVTPPASAEWYIENGASRMEIINGGTFINDIRLWQGGVGLVQGRDYQFEFDAWALAPRVFGANLLGSQVPEMNYSGFQPFTITPIPSRFRFAFRMEQPSDANARVVFNMGIGYPDVFVDNVALTLVPFPTGDLNQDGCVNHLDLDILTSEWLRQEQGLAADLNDDGRVNFEDYAIFGEHFGEGCP